METLTDDIASHRQLAIVERFEGFVNYVYPIALNIRRTHHIVRDRFIDAIFAQVNAFNQAGKSNQISKLYAADAGLADLRFLLRFLAEDKRRLISLHQSERLRATARPATTLRSNASPLRGAGMPSGPTLSTSSIN